MTGAPATDRPTSGAERLPAAYRRFLLAFGLSCVGTGLVYPLSAVYLADRQHLGARTAAMYFAAIALCSILSTPLATLLSRRLGPSGCTLVGVVLQGLGATCMIVAWSLPLTLLAGAVTGVGNALFYTAIVPLVSGITDETNRAKAFAGRYVAANVGIGVGAALGGLLATNTSLNTYRWLFFANAVSYVGLAVVVARMSTPRRTALEQPVAPRGQAAPRNWVAIRLLLFQGIVVAFGFAQFETTVPYAVQSGMGLPAATAGLLVTVNTVFVVAAQSSVTKLLRRRRHVESLRLTGLIWITAYGCALAAALLPGSATWLLLLFAAVFALGECVHAASFYPALTDAAGNEAELIRLSAAGNFVWSLASAVGPAAGVTIAGSVMPPVLWMLFCAGSAMAVAVLAGRPQRERDRR